MYSKIRTHIEDLFRNAPVSARATELKEELIANSIDRYTDLVQQGETEEAAFGMVMAGIGDVDELINGLREQQVWSPSIILEHQRRSAIFISVAVGLIIASVAFPVGFGFVAEYTGYEMWIGFGLCIMFFFIAAGVGLLVYNSKTKPKYIKMEETIVEDFKAWNTQKVSKDGFYKTVNSLIFTMTIPLYLMLGIFFNAWHPGWLVFPLALVASQVFRLIMLYREAD